MIITKYDHIRDKYYMTTWRDSDINLELKKVRKGYNGKYEEYSKSQYYNAILEQQRINRQV